MTPFEPQEQPELTPAAAQVQGMLTPPAPPAGPQADYAAQLAQLLQQSQELQKQLAVDPQAQLRDMVQSSLGDLQTYQDKQYKQKYGGGGKGGTAVRVLTDALRGFNKQGTLKDATDESAKKDYEVALKELTQQVATDRNAKTEQLRALQAQATAVAPIVKQQEEEKRNYARRHEILQGLVDKKQTEGMTGRDMAEFLATGKMPNQVRPVTVGVFTRADELPPDAIDINGNPVDRAGGKYFQPQVSSLGIRYTEGMPPTTVRIVPDQTSKTGFSQAKFDRSNRQVGELVKDATPPAGFVPTVSNNTHDSVQEVQDPTTGQVIKKIVPLNSKTTTQKILGGTVVNKLPSQDGLSPVVQNTQGGQVIGVKPLTPYQQMEAGGKLGAFDNTISLVHDVQQRLPILNDMISAGKISLAADPKDPGIIRTVLNRTVPLTPNEAKLAADFISLTEHINTLRGPLGATGFRGAEAFSALQAQRGQILANPEVTKNLLTQTEKALTTQRTNVAKALGPAATAPEGAIEIERGPDGKLRRKTK